MNYLNLNSWQNQLFIASNQPIPKNTYLEIGELKLLYEFLKYQYIDYEKPELLEVVRKIARIVEIEK